MRKEFRNKDHMAMVAIADLLDGQEWTPDTLDAIAEIVRNAGYIVALPPLNEVPSDQTAALPPLSPRIKEFNANPYKAECEQKGWTLQRFIPEGSTITYEFERGTQARRFLADSAAEAWKLLHEHIFPLTHSGDTKPDRKPNVDPAWPHAPKPEQEFLPRGRDAALHVVKNRLYAIRAASYEGRASNLVDELIDLIERS